MSFKKREVVRTYPETKSSPLKIDALTTILSLEAWPIFRGKLAVSLVGESYPKWPKHSGLGIILTLGGGFKYFFYFHPEKIWGRWDPVWLIFSILGLVETTKLAAYYFAHSFPLGYLRTTPEGSGSVRFLKHGFGWIPPGCLGRGRQGEPGKPWMGCGVVGSTGIKG